MDLKFSVVINTYNRADLLADALRGLSHLTYTDFEIIVVNGPSSDHTEEVLSNWAGRIKVGTCEQPNLSMSRNTGVALASGDVIAFIDDDAVPHPSWLQRLASHYGDQRVGAVGGYTIDNSGVTYQCKKTLCDRFGNAYYPSDLFDERPLCFPGSPIYPSLLGTNSSFRASALYEIGGFDHTFAYLLDETDVCLRLIDRGYRIVYEPSALVYHQFAPSHIRTKNRIPKTLYPSAVSKSYFIRRHGALFSEQRASEELRKYEVELLGSNRWLAEHGEITREHQSSLDDDVLFGIRDGRTRAMETLVSSKGDRGDLVLPARRHEFVSTERSTGLTIALISKSFPPGQEAGIARWTWMMARGLSERGHRIHVVTLSPSSPYTRFQDGYWVHGIVEDTSEDADRLAFKTRVPASLARWSSAVRKHIARLKTFGLQVASFPIWDIEGIGLLDNPSIGLVMSLHTSYALAKPFKPEWLERPLLGYFHVDRVIAAEARLLNEIPHILANSKAIVDDLEAAYSVSFRDKAVVAPHGTFDPFDGNASLEESRGRTSGSFKVAYIGRFEKRKGFDLACTALCALLDQVQNVEICIIGDTLTAATRRVLHEAGASRLLSDTRVSFLGTLSRKALDDAYIRSDVVLMPSRYESFGLVAIEAMAAGSPVVCLAVGGLTEVVEDGVNGFLVPEGENAARELAGRLITLSKDTDLLQHMKQQARQSFLAKFKVEDMVEAAEPVYLAAAGRSVRCN